MHPVEGKPDFYEFREESLPFALALLTNSELKDALKNTSTNAEAVLDNILDPVRGFQLISQVVAAAIGLASLERDFPRTGLLALVKACLGLQNLDEQTVGQMLVYVTERPDILFEVAETTGDEADRNMRAELLRDLLLRAKESADVKDEILAQMGVWLRRWSRTRKVHRQNRSQFDEMRQKTVTSRLASLSQSKAGVVGRLTTEVAPSFLQLDGVAAIVLAGENLLPVADGIAGWSRAQPFDATPSNTGETLAWIVRLNERDWQATAEVVTALIGSITAQSSEGMRIGAAIALRLLGDRASADVAEKLNPASPVITVDRLASEDPLDPRDHPPDLEQSRRLLRKVDPEQVWVFMSQTSAEHELEAAMPTFIRHSPAEVIEVLRRVLATLPKRSGLALRQISWRLPELAPLLQSGEVASLRQRYSQVIASPDLVERSDLDWILLHLFNGFAPHLPAREQLRALLELPPDARLFESYMDSLKPLEPDDFELFLVETSADSQAWRAARVLLFGSIPGAALTQRSEKLVADAFFASDDTVGECAAAVALNIDASTLYKLIADRLGRRGPPNIGHSHSRLARALATAIVREKRDDLLHHVPQPLRGWVVSQLDPDAVDSYIDYLEALVSKLGAPPRVSAPRGVELTLTASANGLEVTRSVDAESAPADPEDIQAFVEELNNPVEANRRHSERRIRMLEKIKEYERDLAVLDEQDVLEMPPMHGIAHVVARDPHRVSGWLESLRSTDGHAQRQAKHLALVLAAAISGPEPELATSVFRRFRTARSIVNVEVLPERLPFDLLMIFRSDRSEPVEALWRELFSKALNDKDLDGATRACELNGHQAWLHAFVKDLSQENTPRRQALALTIARFAQPDPWLTDFLHADQGKGVLGDVIACALANYSRASWARHWMTAAISATSPTDFWRYCKLVEEAADLRVLIDFERLALSPFFSHVRSGSYGPHCKGGRQAK